MQETRVRSLGREGPLDKEMATHSSIHAWKIPWTEEPGGLQSMGLQRVGHDWATSLLHFSLLFFFNSRKALANSPSSCLTQLEEFGQWTQNTKERSHTHAHRLRSKENKEAVYLGQKYNLHTQRRRVPKHLTLRSTQQGSRSPTPTFISFSVLWMGGGLFFFFWGTVSLQYCTTVFLIGVEYSPRGGLRCGLDCPRSHQFLVLSPCLSSEVTFHRF